MTTYYLKSSVLDDEIVEELNSSGQKTVGYVRYPGGQSLARQAFGNVIWQQMTPAGTSRYDTSAGSSSYGRTELDPMGADIPLDAPPVPDTNGGEGDIGANHSGGILDSRWSNFFDLSGGCSSQGYTAACHAPMSPDAYLDAANRPFFGPQYYDLPGHGSEMERGEQRYVWMLTHATDPEQGSFYEQIRNALEQNHVDTDIDSLAAELANEWNDEYAGGLPQNPATKQGGPCDQEIASIFGDDDAIAAASGFEPTGFADAWRNGQNRSQAGGSQPNQWGHLNGYSGHIYGSSPGTSDTTLYVPGNFTSYTRPSGNDSVATFYYGQLGNQQNVTLAVFHVANFGIQRNNTNDAGSVRIGTSGGPGGDTVGYRHSHLEVHAGRGLPATMARRNRTRQFFSRVFCP